jgi:hypothetical protein
MCKAQLMKLIKIGTVDQVADSLTKGTTQVLFEAHRDYMLGHVR